MIRRILLPTILAVLAWGFWISPDFRDISAGVAIFLFGMLAMEQGFRAFTGGALERVLKRTTNRMWKSLAFGTVTTTVLQSSSLVSVITISFLSAGLISLVAGIGIVFGANLGTTTGAWLVAGFGLKVKLSSYAMPMLVFGVVLVFQRSKVLHGLGYVLTGIGFLFLGIHHMKEGFEAFKTGIDLSSYAMTGYGGLFVFVAIGVVATVVMQSSHATLVLVITALSADQVSYENALALAIGSNVGTTITAILGAMSADIQGKRLAAAHLLFNVATGFIAIASIFQLMAIVKLAVFHTVFNLIGVIVMTPFVPKIARALERWLPTPEPAFEKPKYLNEAVIDFPDSAIEAARLEVIRLYDKSIELIVHGIGLRTRHVFSETPLDQRPKNDDAFEDRLEERYEQSIKSIYGSIVEFISRAQVGMERENAETLFAIRMAGRDVVEAVKGTKHLHKNMKAHVRSDNAAVRDAYEEIRQQIGNVLRDINNVRQPGGDSLAILSLDDTRVAVKQQDVLANGKLDELIRAGDISAADATSLINDNGYAYGICKNLINMGQVVFAVHDEKLRDAELSLALDDYEIEALTNPGTSS
jgi:phosphate:Na+ symporter